MKSCQRLCTSAAIVLIAVSAFGQIFPRVIRPNATILGDIAGGTYRVPSLIETRDYPGPRGYQVEGRYMNFSVRGTVAGSNQPLIAGFAVGGKKITLIRAIGPTLGTAFGMSGTLARPRLELYDSAGKLITTAVAWAENSTQIRDEIKSAAATVGAFALPNDSADAVLLAYLGEGTYTCVVTGPDGSSGNVLIEGYDVPTLWPLSGLGQIPGP